MAKSQKHSNKETRKAKDPQDKGKKPSGPKYLRQAETMQIANLGAKRPGQKH
jgi:hypothetical protein